MEITFETPRLRLRKFRGTDLDPYAEMSADPEVMKFIGTGVTLNRNEAWRSMAAMLGHWQLLGYGMWAVELRQTGAFTGLGRERVISLIREGNDRSVRVAEKLGGRHAGDVELPGSKARVYEVRRDSQ